MSLSFESVGFWVLGMNSVGIGVLLGFGVDGGEVGGGVCVGFGVEVDG